MFSEDKYYSINPIKKRFYIRRPYKHKITTKENINESKIN